jgi:CDP-glucose 4,6-dehydratase
MAQRDLWTRLDGRSVLVTGHTGFKGSWLSLWLYSLGARVSGYALEPSTDPNHFAAADIASVLTADIRGDIRDLTALQAAVHSSAPDVIFHLAAQPIVQRSLVAPRDTFDINVLGTATLLDTVREASRPCAVVVVTSDKCYRNEGSPWGFREIDPLGGHDPYSASKAACELVVDAYRASFFSAGSISTHGVRLASARAGNVIGGGDWGADRIVPDAVRALSSGDDLILRNPGATRPWQHVLEPLSGYLTLAACMLDPDADPALADAWNFGPLTTEEATVAELATAVVESWGSGRWVAAGHASANIEAKTLRIAIEKAVSELGWRPRWDFAETVRRTVSWYHEFYASDSSSLQQRSLSDIAAYEGA